MPSMRTTFPITFGVSTLGDNLYGESEKAVETGVGFVRVS